MSYTLQISKNFHIYHLIYYSQVSEISGKELIFQLKEGDAEALKTWSPSSTAMNKQEQRLVCLGAYVLSIHPTWFIIGMPFSPSLTWIRPDDGLWPLQNTQLDSRHLIKNSIFHVETWRPESDKLEFKIQTRASGHLRSLYCQKTKNKKILWGSKYMKRLFCWWTWKLHLW